MSESTPSGSITRPLVIVILSICFGSNFQFYSFSVINNIASICQSWFARSFHDHYGYAMDARTMNALWSLSSAAVPIGCLLGSLFTQLVADRLGRRRALALISLLTVIGSIMDGVASTVGSFELFIVGRFLLGAGLGCGMPLASMYITEIAPTRFRGACGSCQQFLIGLGNLLSFVLTLSSVMGNETWWPVAVSVPTFLTATVQLLVLLFYAHDTPRFLILTKNDRERGLRAVRFYQGDKGAEERSEAIMDEKRALEKKREENGGKVEKFKFIDLIRKAELRRPLLISFVMALGVQMSGMGAVLAYSNTMLTQAGLTHETAEYASLGLGLCKFLSPLFTLFFVERAGRKMVLLVGFGMCNVALLALTICVAGSQLYAWPGAALGAIPCLYVFQSGFALASSVALIAPPEMFPQECRASAMTVVFGVFFALQSIVVLGYLPFAQAVGVAYSFIPFIFCEAAAIVLTVVFMPETKGKTMEQVAAMFQGNQRRVADSSRKSLENGTEKLDMKKM